jgi:hypothetical protein
MLGDPLILEVIDDPAHSERRRVLAEAFRRNVNWLEAHWPDLLPQARGKHLAVAGEEAFIADSPEEALAWIEANHPEDIGSYVRYVILEKGPRIYSPRLQVRR